MQPDLQGHLHVGRMTAKRIARLYLILIIGVALPLVLGLRHRVGFYHSINCGEVVAYDGFDFGATRYYAVQTGRFYPNYVLIPPFLSNGIGLERVYPQFSNP